jgi:diguanylate cyclase (GGDEF)-like protein
MKPMAAVALGLAAAIAAVVLLLWYTPAYSGLPPVWSKMPANTATAMLLSAFCLACSFRKRPEHWRGAGIAAAIVVLLLGTLSLSEYLVHIPLGIDRLLPNNPHIPYPGRPSPQSAFGLTMLAITMLTLRQIKNVWSRLSDFAALASVALNLVMLGGHVYGVNTGNFGDATLMAPQTLLAFICFSAAVVTLRAEQGDLFAVLVNRGIGSRIVRTIMPFAILVPFLFLSAETFFRKNGTFGAAYAAALASAAASILTICVVTWMGWRINSLERELRDQSLTDELTGTYNRRGFYFLGFQAIREAERARNGLAVFFCDLDGLKRVNDVHGHEIGSEMIRSFAGILNATFRKSDIVGRVGGDEFAVITIRDGSMWMEGVYARLNQLANAHNNTSGQLYRLSFSIGHAELELGRSETLDDIIARADTMMYADKAAKKTRRLRMFESALGGLPAAGRLRQVSALGVLTCLRYHPNEIWVTLGIAVPNCGLSYRTRQHERNGQPLHPPHRCCRPHRFSILPHGAKAVPISAC